jgi:hypothetical protein
MLQLQENAASGASSDSDMFGDEDEGPIVVNRREQQENLNQESSKSSQSDFESVHSDDEPMLDEP